MKTEIFPDYKTFLARQDKRTNGVTQEFALTHTNWGKETNSTDCRDCWNYKNNATTTE